jgi:hypothetical protein
LLALPAVAFAAKATPATAKDVSFSLGGYVKLHMFWDSAILHKNWLQAPPINNDPTNQHGRFNANAQSSRFNFKIKGPTVFGAKTTGYIEVDFDANENRQTASNSWQPRLRHAFFRFNWPSTELLLGQYWDFFSFAYPEMIQDGPFQGHGQATHRLAQARLTQTFAVGPGKMTISGLIGTPADTNDSGDPAVNLAAGGAFPREGQTSETPQLQAKLQWEGDPWGKAGFYGRPRGLTAHLCFGWQRSRYRLGRVSDPFNLFPGVPNTLTQKYTDNWCLQGTVLIPVIPTTTKSLAGTCMLSAQAYFGQGLDFIGNDIFNSFISTTGVLQIVPGVVFPVAFERQLAKTVGGYVQANYYFNNQWFMNAAIGWATVYGINGYDAGGDQIFRAISGFNGLSNRQAHQWWELDINLYYRPVKAFTFGLG